MAETNKIVDLNGLSYYNKKINEVIDDKVDKVEGMGLSANNFTDAHKSKLESITNPMLIKGTVASIDSLPTEAEVGWFYFVGADGSDTFDEYIYTESGTWEFIGVSEEGVDLSNYYKKSETDELLDNKLDSTTKYAASDSVGGSALKAVADENGENIADNMSNIRSGVVINKSTIGYQCKNILKNTATTQTKNGITFTVNEDKSITVNGTATANTTLWIGSCKIAGEYILTGCPSGGTVDTYMTTIIFTKLDGGTVYNSEIGSGKTITLDTTVYSSVGFMIEIKSGVTVTDLTYYTMLRFSDVADSTYEPHKEDVNTRLSSLENVETTKVEDSSTNGNIKVNGAEITVYEHPIGTNPHGTTKDDIGLENVENKSSATIREELTKKNVTDALGYTPPKQDTTYTLSSFGITATADELNKLDGVTANTTELNYVDGVTSNIQTQLNNRIKTIQLGTTLATANYCIFAQTASTNDTGNTGATLLVSDAGNIGNGCTGLWAVQISNRGSKPTMHVTTLIPHGQGTVNFGYYIDSTNGYFYFGVYTSSYRSTLKVSVIRANNVTIENFSDTSTVPTGWTTVESIEFSNTSHTHDYLPLTGGTMDESSAINIPYGDGSTGRILRLYNGGIRYLSPNSAAWASGLLYRKSDDSASIATIGACGTGETVDYYYIGSSYSNPFLKIDGSTGVTTLSSISSTCGSLLYQGAITGASTAAGNTITMAIEDIENYSIIQCNWRNTITGGTSYWCTLPISYILKGNTYTCYMDDASTNTYLQFSVDSNKQLVCKTSHNIKGYFQVYSIL